MKITNNNRNITQNLNITREQTTVLKAIAILAVIITHANGVSRAFEHIPVLKDGIITTMFCQGGMCIFLILSGYGLFSSYSRNGLQHFWDNKFLKIFFPVMVAQVGWCLFYNIIKFILEENVEINWNTIFGDLVCVNAQNGIDGSIWYMSFLLFCYICFYCIFRFFKSTKVAMIVFSVLWIVLMPIMIRIWENGLYCVSAFGIGVWVAFLCNQNKLNINIYVRVVALIIFIIIGYRYYFVIRQSRIVDNIVSNTIAFAFIILFGFVNIEKCRVLNFIGKHSFSIYIFQGKIIFGWFPYQNYTASIRLIVFIVLFFVNILIAVVFDRIIKMITVTPKTKNLN